MAADNADVLAADNADVLAAGTTDVLAADNKEAPVPVSYTHLRAHETS